MNRLRFQLVAVLVLAIVLPLLPAALATRELFRRSLDPLFATGLKESSEAGLELARVAIDGEKAAWTAALTAGAGIDTLSPGAVAQLGLERRGLRPTGQEVPLRNDLTLLRPPELLVNDTNALLVAELRGQGGVPVWVSRPLPEPLAMQARRVERGNRLLGTMRREHGALLGGLQSTFLAVYLALVALVLAVGLSLVSRLTRPLADLTAGIDRVAGGDFSARVPEHGSAEVKSLMSRFNDMATRLDTQHKELVRLERVAAWRTMARFLAHEIKNPLTPIQLAAEHMRDAYRGDDPAYRKLVDESAGIIAEEVTGLREWVSEFSQFGRLPDVRPAQVPSHDLVLDLTALYGENVIAARVEQDSLQVWCDRDQLKRALVNLIDNARAAMKEAGREARVELTIARRHDGCSVLRVRDHGPGIPPENRSRVFEPDYTTKRDGMGLGLAIVETIVRQHGGSVAIIDTAGEGATFEVVLPAAPAGGIRA